MIVPKDDCQPFVQPDGQITTPPKKKRGRKDILIDIAIVFLCLIIVALFIVVVKLGLIVECLLFLFFGVSVLFLLIHLGSGDE